MLGIAAMAALRRYTRLKQDAVIAVVLGVFFGVGVALLSVAPRFAEAAGTRVAGLKSFIVGQTAGLLLEDVVLIAALAVAVLLVVAVLYKEFKLVTFDPDFGSVQGWPTFFLDFVLQVLVVVVVIVGLPAVGVLLVAALVVIPAAAARFWTDRLGVFLVLASSFGALAGAAGAYLSAQVRGLSTGPTITLCAAGLFVLSLFLGGRRGLVWKWSAPAILPPPPVPGDRPA
jgi:manganese/zinc/iron transport system permease protein